MRGRAARGRLMGLAVLGLASLGAASCDGPGGSTAESETESTLRAGTVELSIGSTEGEDAYVFGRVSGLALHEDGRILVGDQQANEVRVFSETGAFAYAIGRTGAGPGELDGPCCLAFDRDGLLWVRDGGNGRYDVFRPGRERADFIRAVKMAHGDINRWAPITFDEAGRVVDIGLRPDLSGGEMRTARIHLDSSGTATATVLVHTAPPESVAVHRATRQTPAGPATRFIYQPHGRQELVAHSPAGGYAYALSTQYTIAWFDAQGVLMRETRRDNATGPALTANERAEAERQLEAQAKFVGATAASLPFRVPDHKPVLNRLFFDTEGRLWVQLSVSSGEPRLADVFDATGAYLHRAEWPPEVDLSLGAIRGDAGLGVAADSLGVQRVVRLRFTRAAR